MKAKEQIEKALVKSKMARYENLKLFTVDDTTGQYAVYLSRNSGEKLLIAQDSRVNILCKKLHAITADFSRLPEETMSVVCCGKVPHYYEDLPHYEIPFDKMTVDEVVISAVLNTGVRFSATRNPSRGKLAYDYTAMMLERYTNTWLAPILCETTPEKLSSSIFYEMKHGGLDALISDKFGIEMVALRTSNSASTARLAA